MQDEVRHGLADLQRHLTQRRGLRVEGLWFRVQDQDFLEFRV